MHIYHNCTISHVQKLKLSIVYNYCNLHKCKKFYKLKFTKTCHCLVRRTELVYKKSIHHMHFLINVHMEFTKKISVMKEMMNNN